MSINPLERIALDEGKPVKNFTDMTPGERMLLATLRLAAEPLTFARLIQEAGYTQSSHVRLCLRFLVRSGLVVEAPNPEATGKEDRTVYSLAPDRQDQKFEADPAAEALP